MANSKRIQIYHRSQYTQPQVEEIRDRLSTERIEHLVFVSARGWNLPDHSFIVDFIANSKHLELLDMSWMHFEFVNACMEAANNNTSIKKIIISTETHQGGVPGSLDALKGGKITELKIEQNGALDMDESKVLGTKIASLDKLEKLVLRYHRDEFLMGLMLALSKREESPKLKQLVLRYPQVPTALSGIDVFLGSLGAHGLEDLDLFLHDVPSEAMETLATGLTNNARIKRLSFDCYQISPEASHALADYIFQTPPSLVELQLKVRMGVNHDPNIQDIILPPLYRNSTIQKIRLAGFSDHSCENNVKDLLLSNSNIKELRCNYFGFDIDDDWIRSTADGLTRNSTLESMEIFFGGEHRIVNVLPIFQALLARPVGLRKLDVSGYSRFGQDCAVPVAAVLQSPQCLLKELELTFQWEDDGAVITIISAAQRNQHLKKLRVESLCELSWETWSAIASIIPKLKLAEFSVIAEGDDEEGVNAVEQTQKGLLRALAINQTLCSVDFTFGQPHDTRKSFSDALKVYGIRNMAIAASNGIKKEVNVGGLPLAILPHVLQSLSRQSKSAEQRQQLSNTVVFSLLKSGRLSLEAWKSIKGVAPGVGVEPELELEQELEWASQKRKVGYW